MTTPKLASPSLRAPTLLALAFGLAACNSHPIKPVEVTGNSVPLEALPLDVNRKVDVLLVLDNSGSMGEEQANLAANFGPFIERLEQVGADYRIGIVTTDLGGPNCPSTPNGGELQASSCLDRPADFVFGQTDVFEVACSEQCSLGDADLTLRPTQVAGSDEAAVRPWIESANGVSNLPEGVDPLTAFQCLAPQGISGCGWESPLESIARAIDNMNDESRPEYGFLRDDALLAVLVVTDEVDCSYRPEHEDALFLSNAFWADGASYATSAVCWNAGVACSGDPLDCQPADFDDLGQPTDDPSVAVLHPMSRYLDLLQGVESGKLGDRDVLVSLIAGVPEGYPEVPLVFAASDDPDFQELFGIGAGCTSVIGGVEQTAVPPVRLRALAEAFPVGDRGIYSVCSADYTPAISDIVEGLTIELPPACYGACVRDLDLSTDELDYNCQVSQAIGEDSEELPECLEGGELPEGADACWILKSGEQAALECQVVGQNVEFELVRRYGVAIPAGANVVAACEVSTLPSIDCP
ncbi:vWA domain-containing protein [Nannocystaceae bacterium ST9]